MKKSIIPLLAIALIAAPVLAYKQQDLDKLKLTKSCEGCDLREANLELADLSRANLLEADLRGADLRGAHFCNTTMPDGWINNRDY